MPVVVEFTLHAKPGHFAEVLSAYNSFVDSLEHDVTDLQVVLVAAEAAEGYIRGVGVYDHADVAEGLNSRPFFASFVDRVESLLASPPERIELQLSHLYTLGDQPAVPTTGTEALIELTLNAKPGHYSEVMGLYTDFASAFQVKVPDARLAMVTGDPASGLIRGIVMYEHSDVAKSVNSLPFFAEFIDSAVPLLSAAPTRVEHSLVHLFVREG